MYFRWCKIKQKKLKKYKVYFLNNTVHKEYIDVMPPASPPSSCKSFYDQWHIVSGLTICMFVLMTVFAWTLPITSDPFKFWCLYKFSIFWCLYKFSIYILSMKCFQVTSTLTTTLWLSPCDPTWPCWGCGVFQTQCLVFSEVIWRCISVL